MVLVLGGIFLILLFLGIPIAIAMGISTIVSLNMIDVPLTQVIQRIYSGINSHALLAIPAFLLAGELMFAGRISDGLIGFARNVMGHIRGGMSQTALLASTIFSGISGSAAADTAAMTTIMAPAMKKKGFPPGYTSTLLAFTGAMGPIIPPSILMVIYGGMTGLSIGALFLAGLIPGLVMGVSYFLINYFWIPKMGITSEPRATLKEMTESFIKNIFALIAPLIIIFGILFGVFTPTEAGIIAAVYSFFVGYFYYKGFKLKDVPDILLKTAVTSSIIMSIIAVANAFAWVVARLQVAKQIQELLLSISPSPVVVMLLIIVFLLIVGCFIETVAATIIFGPVLFQIGNMFGYDPLAFGTAIVITLVIGGVTPPVGVLLYISTKIAGISVTETFKYLIPFLIVTTVVILLVAFVEPLTTFLPSLLLNK